MEYNSAIAFWFINLPISKLIQLEKSPVQEAVWNLGWNTNDEMGDKGGAKVFDICAKFSLIFHRLHYY